MTSTRPRAPALATSTLLLGSILVPTAIGTLSFLHRLGAPSLFIDETYSWNAASASLGGVFTNVRSTEVAPPAFYLLLHFWISVCGNAVWTMRLLSALAGIALVVSIWWLGRLLAGRLAGFLAALIAALSPLLVQYAQEVRAYVFVMLCATVAVAAAVEATHRAAGAQRWLVVSATASVATIWLHYTGLLVIAPLALYIVTAKTLSARARSVYLFACAGALAIVAPLIVIQLSAGHEGGAAPYARLSTPNLLSVIGTPFNGRFAPQPQIYIPGAIAVAGALIWLIGLELRPGRRVGRDRWLVLAAAILAPLAITAITAAADILGKEVYDSLNTRYTAVAAPFMAIALAWAIVETARSPRLAPLAITLTVAGAIAAFNGLKATYLATNFPLNLSEPFAQIIAGYRPGDTVVTAGLVAQRGEANYYVRQLRLAHRGVTELRVIEDRTLMPATGMRLWVVTDTVWVPVIAQALAKARWQTVYRSVFVPSTELVLASR